VELQNFYVQIYQFTLFLVSLGSLTKCHTLAPIGLTRPYKSRVGPKRGENVALKSQEYYYIVSNYNNVNQLTLFLVLIGKFDQKSNQTFILNRSEVGI